MRERGCAASNNGVVVVPLKKSVKSIFVSAPVNVFNPACVDCKPGRRWSLLNNARSVDKRMAMWLPYVRRTMSIFPAHSASACSFCNCATGCGAFVPLSNDFNPNRRMSTGPSYTGKLAIAFNPCTDNGEE